MANKIKLTIQVNDDGSLGIIGKKAKEAAGATDKLDKSTKQLNKSQQGSYRTMQGAAHTSSGLTKNFAKQAQGIGGGLVPAYAVLAANIFAVTAAFGALQRAAQVQQLTAGVTALGQASGIAMGALARDLQRVTGNAINMEDALRSTSMVISAGFSPDTLSKLGEVAKNTSIALGRDMSDSMNRLVRGAVKLEPELLDELGIMVRLDQAAQEYAIANNKLASQLTLAEKRQAFMNAVLEEGERKFSAIGNAVDVNPYDKLAASFNDLTKTVLGFLNTALVPFVEFLNSSTLALVGVLSAFGGTIIKSMAPSIAELGQRYGDLALEQENAQSTTLGLIAGMKNVPPKFKQLQTEVEGAADKTAILTKMQNSAQKSMNSNAGFLKENIKLHGAESKQAIRSAQQLKGATAARNAATVAIQQQAAAQALLMEAELAGLVSAGQFGAALDGLPGLFGEVDKGTKKAQKGVGKFMARSIALNGVLAKVAISLRLMGTAFITMIPMLAAVAVGVAAVGAAGYGIYRASLYARGINKEIDLLNSRTEKLKDVTSENRDIFKEVAKAYKGTSETINTFSSAVLSQGNAMEIQNGVIQNQIELFEDLFEKGIEPSTDSATALHSAVRVLTSNNPDIADAVKEFQKDAIAKADAAGETRNYVTGLKVLISAYKDVVVGQIQSDIALKDYGKSLQDAQKPLNELYSSFKNKTPYDEAVSGITQVREAIENMDEVGRDLTNMEDRLRLVAENAVGALGNSFSEEVQAQLKKVRDLGPDQDIPAEIRAQASAIVGSFEIMVMQQEELFKTLQEQHLIGKANLDIANQQIKRAKVRQLTESDAVTLFAAQNRAKRAQIQLIDNEIKKQELILKNDAEDVAAQSQLKKLLEDRRTLTSELLDLGDQRLMIAENQVNFITEEQRGAKALLNLQSKINAAKSAALILDKAIAEENAKAASAAMGDGRVQNPQQAYDQANDNKVGTEKAIKEEARIRIATINMEFTLLRGQLEVQRIKGENLNKEIAANNASIRKFNEEFGTQVPLDKLIDLGGINAAIALIPQAATAAVTAADTEMNIKLTQHATELNDLRFAAEQFSASEAENRAVRRLKLEQEGQRALNDILTKQQQNQDKINQSKREVLERQKRAESLANPALRESVITAEQRADIEKTLQEERIKAIESERDIKIAMVNMEYDLLSARLAAAKAEAVFLASKDPKVDETAVAARFDASIAAVSGARERATTALSDDASNRVANVIEGVTDAARAKLDKATGAVRGEDGNITSPNAGFDTAVAGAADTISNEEAKFTEKTASLAQAGLKLQETLNSFGTENPAMTAALGAAVNISNAWTGAFEKINEEGATTSDKIQAGLGAVGATIGAMAQVQKASSDQRISAIDSEIDAEKKRDGKSKESLAKIASLEKKKQAEKRKAFEQNKKMQIAQTVIATAQAAMSAYSSLVGIPVVGPALAAAAAAAAIALGMKQVQMIQSQTMDGGGAGGMSGPTAVSVGQRGTGIDIAKSQSARGELGYMRGESGTGGPENFKPAFAGAKYRAAGGETAGYVVGEQGPELFVPSAPGTIVPNDDMPTGTPINATFNINTIDASGVEDILVSQRGNIIGMIREGANSYGKGFLEEVDTSIYTPSAGGVSRY